MLRSVWWIVVLCLAVLSLAVLAGTEARAGGVGHRHGAGGDHHAAHAAPAAVASGGTGALARAEGAPVRVAGLAAEQDHASNSDDAPCGKGHADDGSACCGVACHAMMFAATGMLAAARPPGLPRLCPSGDGIEDHLVLALERPPRI